MKTISVAIDGPSGAGKSTLARQAAKDLGYIYVDTGAIYRSVALYCKRNGVDASSLEMIPRLLTDINVDLVYDDNGTQHMILNGEDVSNDIRLPEISMFTSTVSAIPEVREFLLEKQRELARTKNVIMDGRDIGTVVLPDASVKIYLTATSEARAKRRFLELHEKGIDVVYEDVLQDVEQRDYNDSHRDISPLRCAEDATVLDTTQMDLAESLIALVSIIKEAIDK